MIVKFKNNPEQGQNYIEMEYTIKSKINIEGKEYEIELLDTLDEEQYLNLLDMWLNFGEGFILIFDINNRETFEYIKNLKEKRKKKAFDSMKKPIVLVGNKIILEDKREISYNEAKKLADSWGAEYCETSSKENINCREPFELLAKKILKYRKK